MMGFFSKLVGKPSADNPDSLLTANAKMYLSKDYPDYMKIYYSHGFGALNDFFSGIGSPELDKCDLQLSEEWLLAAIEGGETLPDLKMLSDMALMQLAQFLLYNVESHHFNLRKFKVSPYGYAGDRLIGSRKAEIQLVNELLVSEMYLKCNIGDIDNPKTYLGPSSPPLNCSLLVGLILRFHPYFGGMFFDSIGAYLISCAYFDCAGKGGGRASSNDQLLGGINSFKIATNYRRGELVSNITGPERQDLFNLSSKAFLSDSPVKGKACYKELPNLLVVIDSKCGNRPPNEVEKTLLYFPEIHEFLRKKYQYNIPEFVSRGIPGPNLIQTISD